MRKTLFNLFLAAAVLFLSWPGLAQSRLNVSGTVTDQGGYPVAGAAVLVDGTGKYAVSADNGTWSIDGVASNATLTVSCLGYEDASVPVNGRAIVNIVLSESSIMLEETVAIGYGRMKKSDLTGSVASVNPENLVSKPANSIENLMQGRIAGVQITNASQDPGASSTVRVRGNSSVNGSNAPLLVVDGFPFGDAGNRMVIEEFMTGREVSVLSFVDGKTIKVMTSAQDHKRAKDGDQGLNTGGMGTFSPSPFYTAQVDEFCKKYIYQATVDAMAAEGRPFKGVIFFGLMITPNGPRVLEYNARFGDPEAQVVLPRMKNDIIEVMEACVDGTLDKIDLQFEDNAAVCVVLASDGYPVSYEKGFVIQGLERFEEEEGYYCFHAGTKQTDKGIVTNGGRVLGVTAKGRDLKEARANAYAATEWISFDNKYMRHDIGKAIDEA